VRGWDSNPTVSAFGLTHGSEYQTFTFNPQDTYLECSLDSYHTIALFLSALSHIFNFISTILLGEK